MMSTFRKYIILCLVVLPTMYSIGQSSGGNWFHVYGNGFTQCGSDVECTVNDNIVIGGLFYSSLDFDPGSGDLTLFSNGSGDAFISMLDNSGNLLWVKHFGDIDHDWIDRIESDQDENLYITGGFDGTVDFDPGPATFNLSTSYFDEPFLSKFSSTGDFLWAVNFGFEDDLSRIGDIAIDSIGNVYVVGTYTDSADFDPGPGLFQMTVSSPLAEMFLLKLDSLGNLIWALSFPSAGDSWGTSIDIDKEGNLFVAGMFGGLMDFDPGPGTALHNSSTMGGDNFVLKLDSSLNYLWSHAFYGEGTDGEPVLAVDQNNSVIIASAFTDTIDFDPGAGVFELIADQWDSYVLKLDSSGTFEWAKGFGGKGSQDYVSDICISVDGSINITGPFSDSCNFDGETSYINTFGLRDIYTMKLDSDGSFRWLEIHGGETGNDNANGIDSDSHGAVYATGCFFESSNFVGPSGHVNVSSQGAMDLYLQKYHESLNLESIESSEIGLYPNPVQSELYLKADYSFNFEIYNLNGQKILSSSIAASEHYVNVNALDKGIYSVYFFSDDGSGRTRFIKM